MSRTVTRQSKLNQSRRRLMLHGLEDRSVPANFVVSNTADSGAGSLRDALAQATANLESDTITITATGVITLQTELLVPEQNGLLIDGPGASSLSITSNTTTPTRLVSTAGSLPGIQITIQDLTLTGGKAVGLPAGAVLSNGANLSLVNTVVSNNTGEADGGAIRHYTGDFSVSNSVVSGNTAKANADTYGGAIALFTGTTKVTIENSTFTGNTATVASNTYFGYGGAIAALGTTATITVTNTEFRDNTADGGAGGAILNTAGELVISKSVFRGNHAPRTGIAGAIYHEGTLPITVLDTTFVKNIANVSGGAILTGTAVPMTIQRCTFDQSKAETSAGGAIRWSTLNGVTVLIEDTTFTNNSTGNSGGVFTISGSATGGTIILRNSTFHNNSAAGNGGVFRSFGSFDGTLNIENVTASGNFCGNGGGGGGFGMTGTAGLPVMNIVSSIIAGNKAKGSFTDPGADVVRVTGAMTIDFSLIGVGPATTTYTVPTPGSNKLGTTAAPLDAKLMPIVNYGGPTRTMVPMPTSPAAGAGTIPVGVTLNADQRADATLFPRNFGGTVDIGAVEINLPVPYVSTVTAPNLTAAGGTSYEFLLTLTDSNGIDENSLKVAGAVTVSEGVLGSASVTATYVKTESSTATSVTARYSVAAPGGTWDSKDNGIYAINLKANTISDLDAPPKFASGVEVGSFTVGVPQVFVVNATNDETTDTDGKLSFREALAKANASAGEDTVSFDAAVFAGDTTITILDTNTNYVISDTVKVINGTGKAITLDANLASTTKHNIITINGTGVIDVYIEGLGFINGLRDTLGFGQNGGAVFVGDENVTFVNSRFENNKAALNGGAIGGSTGNLTVIDSVFVANVVEDPVSALAFSGGAIGMEGTGNIFISGSTFGFLDSGTGLPDPTKANVAAGAGGAVALIGNSKIEVVNSKFYGNDAKGDGNVGGGLLVSTSAPGATATITSSTFIGNTASNAAGVNGGAGGGIAFIGVLTATIDQSTFSKNTVANGEGGAVWVREAATDSVTLNVTRSKFTENEANGLGAGGAIASIGTNAAAKITVSESTFTGNKSAGLGGAIAFNDGGQLTVTGSTFNLNTAAGQGGAVAFGVVTAGKTGTVLISNSTFSANEALLDGGGLTLGGAGITATVQNTTFTLNKTGGSGTIGGGGIAVTTFTGSTFKLSSTIVAGNIDVGATAKPDVASDTALTTTGNTNLIGAADGTGLTFGGTGHKTGTVASPLNPLLNPLADNKGPTFTHSLQASSPALNAGNNDAGLTTDQRGPGFVRTFGGQTDIGAFEDQIPAPLTATITVDDGTNQRSRITSLTVTFSAPVTFVGAPEAAFQLVQAGTANAVTLAANVNGAVVTLTFSGPLTEATSLKDGNYQLTVFANQIVGTFDGGGGPGSNLVFGPTSGNKGLFRLFGDSDGDRDVDFNDFLGFRGVFGQPSTPTGPGYYFNADGSASVDFTDFLAFRTRFGTTLNP